MVGWPNFVRVVKMGKEIGIIVVETLTGEQDENMDCEVYFPIYILLYYLYECE